jgi:hypothetical protein
LNVPRDGHQKLEQVAVEYGKAISMPYGRQPGVPFHALHVISAPALLIDGARDWFR